MIEKHGQNVLVTGGAGYIGSHAVLALCAAGYRVVVVDNLSTGRRQLVPGEAAFIEGDVGDETLMQAVLQEHACQGILHFAGSVSVAESVAEPLKYYQNNTIATARLMSCCVKAGVKVFVFSSSAMVYGEPSVLPLGEDAETRPANPYGWSKLMTEQMLLDVADNGHLKPVILRYFNVAGADPEGRAGQVGGETTHLIRMACEVLSGKRSHMNLFGEDYPTPDGTCIRDYIHVSDLAAAHVLALEYLWAGGAPAIMNCGYGHGYSVREVLNVCQSLAKGGIDVRTAPRRQGDVSVLVSNSDKIRKTLNWSPKYNDLQLIVETAFNWERSV